MRARSLVLALLLVLPVSVRADPPAGPLAPAASLPAASSPPNAPAPGAPALGVNASKGPAAVPAAVPPAPIRTGNHPGFGRVVFDLPAGASWTLDRAGDRLTVRFSGAAPVAGAQPPRNVRTLTAAAGAAELSLAPGAQVRPMRLDNRLVLDLLDPIPPSASPAPPESTPTRASAPPAQPGSPAAPPVVSAPPVLRPTVPAAKPWAAATPPPAVPPAVPAAAVAAVPAGRPDGASHKSAGSPPTLATTTGPPVPAARAGAAPIAPVPLIPVEPVPVGSVPVGSVPAGQAPVGSLPAGKVPAGPAPAGPVALFAAPTASGVSILLPFAASTGAAAFRRGDGAVLVFDERRPIDTEALHNDRLFGTAEIRLLPAATVLQLGLPAGRAFRLTHGESGWAVAVGDEPVLRPIRPDLDTSGDGPVLRLPAAQPGRSVVVPDPLTGGTLLVGTQREVGQGVAVSRSTPEFTLLPTWQGVAVAAISDALVLRETPEGFVLASALPHGGLSLAKADTDMAILDDAMRLTRRFDFPSQPVPALLHRLQGAVAGTGAMPAGMRTASRIATAQAMLALGLGAEAQALLSFAAANDPHIADDPDLIGLSGIAALLAGRIEESAVLDDSHLTGTDEVALWRALRAATLREGAPDAAGVLAAEMPLLLAYPAPLQSRLLPLAVETMVQGGEAEAAQRLVDRRPGDASLDFARALLAEKRDHAAALTILDRLAQSPDRHERARAAPRAVELRLAAGEITPVAAADAMEKLLFAWRGDEREVAIRLRAAELRAQAGAPRAALAMLRESAEALPEVRDKLHSHMQSIFSAALAADAEKPIPALDLVALAEENPDLIAEGEPGLALAKRLADRLAALDLPRRAAPVLEKLVAAAAPGVVRAELGGRLAATRLAVGDAAGALSVLGATANDALPPPVLEARVLVWARATAARGDPAGAAATLEGLDTPASLELRGHLLEQAKDWKGAAVALRRYADRVLPAEGGLTEPQAGTLLRLAAAASQAGDQAMLAELRSHDLSRLPPGRTADMVRLLTETPVQGPGDLPRARRETALAGGLVGPAGR